MKQDLSIHFNNLQLPLAAQLWLHDFWDVIQGLDDWRDGDAVSAADKEAVIYKTMVAMPMNAFFRQYSSELLPVMSNLVLKWIGANKLEENNEEFSKAYMWRAAYYDLVLEVVRICHGFEAASNVAPYVAKMYGEKFEDYMKEFENA